MAKKLFKRKGSYYKNNNQEKTKVLFMKKQLFNHELSLQQRHVVDFTYAEKFMYGRIDRYNVPMILSRKGVENIEFFPDTTIGAHKFVIRAFNDMMQAFQVDTMNGKIPPDSMISKDMTPVKGYQDPEKLYKDYIDTFFGVIVKRFKRSNKPILNFDQFMSMLRAQLTTGEGIRTMPFTKSAFIKSRFCPINCSGFVIEVKNLKHSNDTMKVNDFFNSPAWPYYVNACNNFGFMIDGNAPWRLVADIESEGMNRAKKAAGQPSETAAQLFQQFYTYVYASDYRDFPKRLLNLYNLCRDKSYVIPEYCNISRKTIPSIVKSENYTVQTLIDKYGQRYFLKHFCELRILEEETTHSDFEMQKLVESALDYYKLSDLKSAIWTFEETLNKTFDYNGSMSYYFKRQEDMDRENEESRPEQGYSAAGAPSPAATGGGATGGGGGTTGGGGGGY